MRASDVVIAGANRRSIALLPDNLVSMIAAGEVVERPASAVKELIENAVDAGATSIDVFVPGHPAIDLTVSDDGIGIAPDELEMAFVRHATSKVEDVDRPIFRHLGFRGEALPALASCAEVTIISRVAEEDCGWTLTRGPGSTERGRRPISRRSGTAVRVRDLFSRIPARLKFLKPERAEMTALRQAFDDAAIARPTVAFKFSTGRTSIVLPARAPGSPGIRARHADMLKADAERDLLPVDLDVDGVRVSGSAAVPTRAKSDARGISIVVNGRPVASRVLAAAVRDAYAGSQPDGRWPVAAIHLVLPYEDVDVNVHPRKTEVRFADGSGVASAVTKAVRSALLNAGVRTSSELADAARNLATTVDPAAGDRLRLPLGRFLGQAGGSWILSETANGMAIVDQHAAHERVVMERMRAAILADERITLVPHQSVRLDHVDTDALRSAAERLEVGGWSLTFDEGETIVEACPVGIARAEIASVLEDIASALVENEDATIPSDAFDDLIATAACRAAIKAGDTLDAERGDALLREIEATPSAGQCNHGRPTIVHLTHADIERLFGRR